MDEDTVDVGTPLSLHSKRKRAKKKLANKPEGKSAKKLSRKIKKLGGRIRKGEDKENETSGQTVNRLERKLKVGKGDSEKIEKRIARLTRPPIQVDPLESSESESKKKSKKNKYEMKRVPARD